MKQKIGEIVACSPIYETAPWNVHHKTKYLNQCLKVNTYLTFFQLLNATQQIEKKLGRTNKKIGAARSIDIDILFFNNLILSTPKIQIPHPRLHLRNFTLIPLATIASSFIHPVFHKSIETILLESKDILEVKIYNKK